MASSDDELVVVDSASAWKQSNERKRKQVPSDGAMSKAKKRKIIPKIPCGICFEDFTVRTIIQLNCDCQLNICRACFNNWVDNSGDLPECCDIKMEYRDYEHILSATNKRKINLRVEELADTHPIYCGQCHEYLKPSKDKDDFSTCGKCKTKTCRVCKKLKKDHFGIHSICPEDDDPALEQLSTKLGWKKCPKCFARIEKTNGCNGMHCRCGCDFMYCCGLRTRDCGCRYQGAEAILAEMEEPWSDGA